MISEELKRIYAGDTSIRYLETLSFHHTRFSKDYYFVNDVQGIDAWLERNRITQEHFDPYPFRVKIPDKDTGGGQELGIVLCNIGMELMSELESANETPEETIECYYRVYINHADKIPEIDPPLQMYISDINTDVSTVVATASRFDILSKAFPQTIYTLDEFPGLRR